ncbi:MAG: DMT family transporter [Comamonas sp.]
MNYLFPLLAVLIWSANTVVSKQAAGVIEPTEIGFLRWLLAVAITTPLLLPAVWRNRAAIRPHALKIVVLGLLGMVVYQSCAYFAASYTTATHMGIILTLSPLVVLVICVGLLGQQLTAGGAAGALIAFAGVLLVVSEGRPESLLDQGINRGDMLMLLACVAYAAYNILLKRWHMPGVSSWQLLYLQMVVAMLAQLPMYLASPKVGITADNWYLVGYAGTLASIVATWMWMTAVERLGPSRSIMFFNLTPLLTALIAAAWAKEHLQTYLWIGGALTIVGVVLAERWKTPLGRARRAPAATTN